MNNNTRLAAFLMTAASGTAFAQSGFLNDYERLQPVAGAGGTDLYYVVPNGDARIASVTQLMVDQVEIHLSPDSEYRGMKPEDVEALAQTMRETARDRFTAGGYAVVEQPGPNVLLVRMALTDLYLKKKKRRVMGYTPWGAAAKAGVDAMKDTLEKLDIIEMSLEFQIAESTASDLDAVLAEAVVARGQRETEDQDEQRIDFDEFGATLREYADRFRCRLDNSKVGEAQKIDCTDPEAREARQF